MAQKCECAFAARFCDGLIAPQLLAFARLTAVIPVLSVLAVIGTGFRIFSAGHPEGLKPRQLRTVFKRFYS
jgi:hypothetical protein